MGVMVYGTDTNLVHAYFDLRFDIDLADRQV